MSESKTPTPRTDAEAKRQENWAEEVRADTYDCWMETFRFARSLELGLNEAKRKLNAIELVRGTHDCGCEVCGMGSAVCPASASSYALAIVEAKDQLTTAQQEIAELRKREAVHNQWAASGQMVAKDYFAELEKDKERLDWLENNAVTIGISALAYHEISATRLAIDKAMREIQFKDSAMKGNKE